MKTKPFTNALLLAALAMPMTTLAKNQTVVPAEKPQVTEVTRDTVEVDEYNMLIAIRDGDHEEIPPRIQALIDQVKREKQLLDDQVRPGFAQAAEPELVEATYLGINAEPLDFDTANTLGLAKGTGLAIGFVSEDSPAAAAGLMKGDVLTRLNDQVLVNAEQLAVLIRTHKEGDAVTLRVLREGVPVELKAELVMKKVPALGPGGANLTRQWQIQRNGPVMPDFQIVPGRVAVVDSMQEEIRKQNHQHQIEMERMLQELREQLELDIDGLPNKLGLMLDPDVQSSIKIGDGKHTLQLQTNKEGVKNLTIKTADGEVLFDGELPEDGKVEGLAPEVQQKVDKLLKS